MNVTLTDDEAATVRKALSHGGPPCDRIAAMFTPGEKAGDRTITAHADDGSGLEVLVILWPADEYPDALPHIATRHAGESWGPPLVVVADETGANR